MNINRIIDKYFEGKASQVTIEVFDKDNIYEVYADIVRTLHDYPEIELTTLQTLAYCFYEILDNVLTHSGKQIGTVVMHYDNNATSIKILVVDDGIGIKQSLSENSKYKDISESEALKVCIKENVTDGKGMGFGLFSTMQLVRTAGVNLKIHSGGFVLIYDGKNILVKAADEWKGTIVYFELHSDKIINPDEVLLGRVDVEGEYETLFEEDDFENLW